MKFSVLAFMSGLIAEGVGYYSNIINMLLDLFRKFRLLRIFCLLAILGL